MATNACFRRYRCVAASPVARTLLMAFLLLVVNRTVLAGDTVGSFEIDGNLILDHSVPPTEPVDWDSSPFPAALTTFTDGTGPTDDIFGLGLHHGKRSRQRRPGERNLNKRRCSARR